MKLLVALLIIIVSISSILWYNSFKAKHITDDTNSKIESNVDEDMPKRYFETNPEGYFLEEDIGEKR